MPRRFPFEAEFFDTLELLPLCVRRKLDLARLKVPLHVWQALPLDERRALRDGAVESVGDLDSFRERVRSLAASAGSEVPEIPAGAPRWREACVPEPLREALDGIGRPLDDGAWAGLDDEARFVLVHLARKGRGDGRLEEACMVIGIPSREAA